MAKATVKKPIGFTVDLSELRDFFRQFPDLVIEETAAVMSLVAMQLESAVVAKTPKGVGGGAGLAGSIAGEMVPNGNKVEVHVGTPFAYGDVIEHGRKPGSRPPEGPIKLWAKRKLGLNEEEATAAAEAIAWKIYLHGTKGVHMFEEALKENDAWIMGQLGTVMARVQGRIGK